MKPSTYIKYLFLLPLPLSLYAETSGSANCALQPYEMDCMDSCSYGEFYVTGSFLYWNAGSNSLYYSIDTVIDPTSLPIVNTLSTREAGFSWDPGVQASLGWRECECGWDFVLRGTYYTTSSQDSITKPLPNLSGNVIIDKLAPFFNPTFSGNFLGSPSGPGTASAKWDLTFGLAEVLGGGSFTPWHCLSLKPHFGLRAAWINQDFKVTYSPISFYSTTDGQLNVLSADKSETKFKNHFWGIGFKGGIDFEASVCSDFRVIGGLGASLLYGKVKTDENSEGAALNPGAPTTLNPVVGSVKQNINKLASDLEAEMGLAYRFGWDCFGLDLSARYLFSIWFDQSEIHNFLFTVPSVSTPQLLLNFENRQKIYSNLIIQGINVQLTLSF